MGIQLVGECAAKFAHLNANPYKALVWMCCRALDSPNPKRGVPARLWFADWPELAKAIGWKVPADTKGKDTMRRDVAKVCRELVAAGAIEKRPHPQGIDNAAYHLVLEPKPIEKSSKRGRRRAPEDVDNLLILDFGSVDGVAPPGGEKHPRGGGEKHPRGGGEKHPRGGGENHPGAGGEKHPRPIKRNQEPVEEGVEEGVQEKGEDDKSRRGQPPTRTRPVDNRPAATVGLGMFAALASEAAKARHARPQDPPIVRPDP